MKLYVTIFLCGIVAFLMVIGLASAGLHLVAKAKCNQAVEIGVEARVVNLHRCFAFVGDEWVEL